MSSINVIFIVREILIYLLYINVPLVRIKSRTGD